MEDTQNTVTSGISTSIITGSKSTQPASAELDQTESSSESKTTGVLEKTLESEESAPVKPKNATEKKSKGEGVKKFHRKPKGPFVYLESDGKEELPDFAAGAPSAPSTEKWESEIFRAAKTTYSEKPQVQPTQSSTSVVISKQHDAAIRSKSLKTEKISISSTISEAASQQQQLEFFPSCAQFTFLRLLAVALLFCAWFLVLAFPCLRFTYHVPIYVKGKLKPVKTAVPLTETCRLMPSWWSEPKEFIERIIQNTRYFKALNSANNSDGKGFNIFRSKDAGKTLKPYNGQVFVIFGCAVLAFPILLLLMFMRCFSKEEDSMEEAMFVLVEISIFCVFTVVEFYMASGVEIRTFMDSVCMGYLERGFMIRGFLKEQLYSMCNDVEIEAWGFVASGSIFLFLVVLFAVDLVILLKNAEQIESRKYLQMAACLRYGKSMEQITKSSKEGAFVKNFSK